MKPSPVISQALLKKFVVEASNLLDGDWLLIGGTVLPLLGVEHRTTTDVDLVGLSNPNQGQTLKLMEIAQKLGLPIEAINQAGAFFVAKIGYAKKRLVLVREGTQARIYRPDLVLFLQLKIERLTDSDTMDCIEMIRLSRKTKETILLQEAKTLIQKRVRSEKDPDKLERLRQIAEKLS